MNVAKLTLSALVAGFLVCVAPSNLMAGSGGSGPVSHKGPGKLGGIKMNPYGVAPLTAVIMSGGYGLKNVNVIVKGKGTQGVDIAYQPSNNKILQYGGIPVFGMYPDYVNTIEVTYVRQTPTSKGYKDEKIKETYKLYAPPVTSHGRGFGQKSVLPVSKVLTPATKKVKNNIYLLNHLGSLLPNAGQAVWNFPNGGALEWDYEPYVWMIDTNGDIRWQLDASKIRDTDKISGKGNFMGFDQTSDGALLWGAGQTYKKYDLMGRKIFDRMLPDSYIDFSHHAEETSKGTYLLRVASADTKRSDGKNVRTVRDVVIELDKDGNMVDEWNMNKILDPYRDTNLLAMDQGAVCLNIDADKSGHTMSKEELEDENAPFGDVTGVGAGRNWAHINSANHDPYDDSIIISPRNQSAVIKIGRDKKVKWILSSKEGWTGELAKKVLTPIDAKGKQIDCGSTGSKCPGYLNDEGGFDWTWTQHTAFVIPEKSKGHIRHISVFDNGDSRGMEQPAFASLKYSRAVEYVVDEKNMTVQQIWEFGKERGFEWYSPVTSVTEYQPKTDTMMIYSATAGMGDIKKFMQGKAKAVSHLHEFNYGTHESQLEIAVEADATHGYRALNIDLDKAFK